MTTTTMMKTTMMMMMAMTTTTMMTNKHPVLFKTEKNIIQKDDSISTGFVASQQIYNNIADMNFSRVVSSLDWKIGFTLYSLKSSESVESLRTF
mmetsp:Transcript_14538/g.30917  ORF Transcript_14538/g.30917 Transcript_14538/m.30917 type:complete len:94 (-) Transcript_14538:8-289(-)